MRKIATKRQECFINQKDADRKDMKIFVSTLYLKSKRAHSILEV